MTLQLARQAGGMVLAFVIYMAALIVPRQATAAPQPVPTLRPRTATPTMRPKSTSSPTPTVTPTPTTTPTPTPTLDPVTEITAGYKVERSLIYLPTIILLNEYDLDPLLVVAVIAAESGGAPYLVSSAGACGPMQVIPKPWFPYSKKAICGNSWVNLIMGMRILRGAMGMAEDRGLGIEYALAFYNCSEASVMTDRCGSRGGLNYADEVLNFWLPRVVSHPKE